MNTILLQIRKRTLIFWLGLVLLTTIPSFTTLLQPGYFNMHDDLQVMRILEMDKCFKDGQIPCRWVPDMGYGYGYPLYNYYPVMPYYLGEAIHALGFTLIWSVKILAIIGFIVSAITMFFLARTFWGNLGGFVSAMFYVYAPYHSVDVYVRGAFAESWSLSWTPAVFLMIYLVIKNPSLRNMLLLSVFSALFLMSHNPMALVFTPIMAVWALIHIFLQKRYKTIPKLALAALWGLGLAAFFTIPVLLEGKYVHLETLFEGYFNYLAHFIDLNQMFITRFWGYGGSTWGPNDDMSFQIGWLHWGLLLVSLPLGFLLWKKDRLKSILIFFFFLVFWIDAFLMHSRSNFIWEKVSILQSLQFPWRLLSITIFTSSFVVGSLFSLKLRKELMIALFVSLAIGISVLYWPIFKIQQPLYITDQIKLSGQLWETQRTAGIFDYLPKTAKFPPGKGAPETVEIKSGFPEISNFKRGTDNLMFSVDSTTSARLRLPIIDYPTWKVFVDNKQITFDNGNNSPTDRVRNPNDENELGQPTFEVEAGHHDVYAKLYNTPVRIISNIISIVSFLGLILAVVKLKLRWPR
jgi:hypothetical protein